MMKFIPITYNTITDTKLHWYYFANYIRLNTTNQHCSFSKENKTKLIITYFGTNAAANTYNTLKISRQAWSAAGGNTYSSPYKIVDEPTAMMPHAVFDVVMLKINELPKKSRNPMWRLFSYVYFNDAHFNGEWQEPQEQMAINLTMSLAYVNRGLKKLIEWGFVERQGKYKFTGEDTFAYRHTIPDYLKVEKVFGSDVNYSIEY